MKSLPTQEQLHELLDYCPETGLFRWKKPRKAVVVGSLAGHLMSHGYVAIRIFGTRYRAHRLAWVYVHGVDPVEGVDHVNGQVSDNRLTNLRLATQSQNAQNRKRHSNNTSGQPGVTQCKKTGHWVARIRINGKRVTLGTFPDVSSAADAYREAQAEHHPFRAGQQR